jgi:ankyrin repeat protein
MFGRFTAAISVGLIVSQTLLTSRAAPGDTRVADAAMRGDRDAIGALVKQADVNGAQGDGMTALHWAASRDDLAMAEMLVRAGANVRATTRLGGLTPLWMASQTGNARLIELLLDAGADANGATTLGVTPIMMAAAVGSVDAVKLLVIRGANVNAVEATYGQSALMFAAARNRPAAIEVLIELGAKTDTSTKVRMPPAPRGRRAGPAPAAPGAQTPAAPSTTPASPDQLPAGNPEEPREAQEPMGGLTPLLYAVRQGHREAVQVLLDRGADINQVSADKTSPLMMAVINGRFDLAMYLLERGADPKITTMAGGTPLYRVVDLQWAPKSFYPQPSTKQEKVSYLELMKALLARGADPNTRLGRQLWYTGYGFELDGLDPAGATPFWRAAQVADLDAMRLLVAAGADPNIATFEGVTPLLAAAGDGFHGNDAITVPAGRMPAVRYLVEECAADVNAIDKKGGDSTSILHTNTRAYTPLHSAAARGDNEMILYLVSKGARVDLVGTNGLTVADMANGPRERIQPFPETVKLLVGLGAKNSNRCVSC